MKIITSSELKSRLTNAALNGSVIAGDILRQINSGKDASSIIRGTANYFGTKRIRSTGDCYTRIKIVFTACNKDISNKCFPDHDNPQAPWFKENRTDLDPATFVSCFSKLPDYPSMDLEYFANSICLDSRVTIKTFNTMQAIEQAYNGNNYSNIVQAGESTLHNSCMRHEETARNAADFYHNFAGAKIIVAMDATQNILGRAILWEKVHVKTNSEVCFSVLDRVYYTHGFIYKMILRYAEQTGVNLRKKYNDYNHTQEFIVLNPIAGLNAGKDDHLSLQLSIPIPVRKWHKRGAPYMDTFQHIASNDSDGQVQLSLVNWEIPTSLARCQSTTGYADRQYTLCPKCGRIHDNGSRILCYDCYNQIVEQTALGPVLRCKTRKYQGKNYPIFLFHKGKPTSLFKLYLQVEKLFRV